MDRVLLITTERTFCLRSDIHPDRCVLIVHPNLSVPPGGWKERTETVTVLRPDGREFEAAAQISVSHFNFKMSERHLTTVDQRWRVTVSFQGLTTDDVPDGSKILASRETRDALLPKPLAFPAHRTMTPGVTSRVVKRGAFLYDGSARCDVAIIQTNFRPGCDDEQAPVEDAYGEFYEIRYSWPDQPPRAGGGYCDSLAEAMATVEATVKEVIWDA